MPPKQHLEGRHVAFILKPQHERLVAERIHR
jgi:hypothetical protein